VNLTPPTTPDATVKRTYAVDDARARVLWLRQCVFMGEEMVSVQADVLESVTDQLASALSCECKTEEVLRTGAADEIAADGPVWTKEKFDSMYRRIMRLCDGDIQGQRHMFLHLATWVQESLTDALSRAEAAEAERDCAVEELREVWRSPVFGPQSPNPFCVPDIVEVLLPGSQPGTVKPGMGRYYERQMPYMADKWLDEADEEILPVAWRPLPAATPQEGKG